MSKDINERLRIARGSLHKLQKYWLEKMNIALADQRKLVDELERERLQKKEGEL